MHRFSIQHGHVKLFFKVMHGTTIYHFNQLHQGCSGGVIAGTRALSQQKFNHVKASMHHRTLEPNALCCSL